MKIARLALLLFILLIILQPNLAQSNLKEISWCATDENAIETYRKSNELIIQKNEVEEYIQNYVQNHKNDSESKKSINFIIPVVFHIMTNNGVGFVSDEDIEEAMTALNKDFQRLNADTINIRPQFKPFAANTKIEFRLAHKDPNGNCTNGIVRAESSFAVNAGNRTKDVSRWNTKKYLNIWSVLSIKDGSTGSAAFPWLNIDEDYGILIKYTAVTNETLGILTHEVGHSLGLYHTFQDSCNASGLNGGDMVPDTPPVYLPSGDCPKTSGLFGYNTCSLIPTDDPYGIDEVDQVENYMSYNSCLSMFSLGQKLRMEGFLNNSDTTIGLKQFTTASNLIATGTNDPYITEECASNSIKKQYSQIENLTIYPNPSKNGNATISFNLSNNTNLEIVLKNILGKEVSGLINNQFYNKGKHTIILNKTDLLESGIYFIQIRANDKTVTKKFVVQ